MQSIDEPSDIDKIRELERARNSKKTKEQDAEIKLTFEEWWMIRRHKIPVHHLREVIKADFMGRKLKNKNTIAEYDEALKRYGINI